MESWVWTDLGLGREEGVTTLRGTYTAKAKALVHFPYYKGEVCLSLLEVPGVFRNGSCVSPEQALANCGQGPKSACYLFLFAWELRMIFIFF